MDPERFDESGYVLRDDVVGPELVQELRSACDRLPADGRRSRAGVRGLVHLDPLFAALADSPSTRAVVRPFLSASAFLTRSILFDKTADTNWDVVWHQDTTIAVRERIDTPGFGPWSVKAGVPHVQPAPQVLEGMVTVRVHLDDCFEDNGPLLVVPGSHRGGILSDLAVREAGCEQRKVACCVASGGALIMRPLILHASRKATAPSHRRVIHLEFAADPLPGGLDWARV